MQVGRFTALLGFFAVATEVTCSSSSDALNVKENHLFLSRNPEFHVRYIMYNGLDWFTAHFERVKESGKDLNKKFDRGNSLLHAAIEEGAVDMVKALINAGADVYQANNAGETPVDLADYLAKNDHAFEDVWNIFSELGYVATNENEENSEEHEEGSNNSEDEESQVSGTGNINSSIFNYNPEIEQSMDVAVNENHVSTFEAEVEATSEDNSSQESHVPDDCMDIDNLQQGLDLIDDSLFNEEILFKLFNDPIEPTVSSNATETAMDTENVDSAAATSTASLPIPPRAIYQFPLTATDLSAEKMIKGCEYIII